MVKIMENPIKMDDLGGFPPIFGNTHLDLPFVCKICAEIHQIKPTNLGRNFTYLEDPGMSIIYHTLSILGFTPNL